MDTTAEIKPANDRELVLTRVMNATPAQLFKAWTTPELMTEWFAPKPYETPVVEIEPRWVGVKLHELAVLPGGLEHRVEIDFVRFAAVDDPAGGMRDG